MTVHTVKTRHGGTAAALTASERAGLNELLATMVRAYRAAPDGSMDNTALYAKLGDPSALEQKKPIGSDRALHSPAKRAVRWQQQTLKHLGLLERVPGKRGVWRCKAGNDLTAAAPSVTLLAYSTKFGLAIWGSNSDFFGGFTEKIALVLTSPPYPLQRPRAYGGPTEETVVDFICHAFEPLVRNLLPGGSIALNISNDIFLKGTPARSMYVERLTLAMHDRFGLSLMDRLVWNNPCKPPGPLAWASRSRQQLNAGYEHVLWFTNDPSKCFANNRRVLQPHTEKHLKFVACGGAKRTATYGDGAYALKLGSYSKPTLGSIPRNVMTMPSGGQANSALRTTALAAGLPAHGALMPLALPLFLIEFLTDPDKDHLVVDPFGGWNRTGLAAQQLGRPWITTEIMAQYAAASAADFQSYEGFEQFFELEQRHAA